MTSKLVDELFISSDGGAYPSPILDMGGKNGAMIELWVTSASNVGDLGEVEATLYGSNDKVNWTIITGYVADSTSAPGYAQYTGSTVIPYSHVRLELEVSTTSATVTALVSAAVRTYTAA